VTSSRSPCRRAFGITPSRVARRARSAQFSVGRRGCRCCRMVSWWCRIKISAVFHISSRWDSRGHAATRVIRRKTNRRHMIDDHHGRAAGTATLLVRAVDGILGTHRVTVSYLAVTGVPLRLAGWVPRLIAVYAALAAVIIAACHRHRQTRQRADSYTHSDESSGP
jgi:hypothetical protein